MVVPTNDPTRDIKFQYTTKYHWPQFDQNVTDANPDEFDLIPGPNLFHDGIQNKEDKVMAKHLLRN